MKKYYVLRQDQWPGQGAYFTGLRDQEEAVFSTRQKRAVRFPDRGMAELAEGAVPCDVRVVCVRRRTTELPSEVKL